MGYFLLRNEWDLNCETAKHLQKVGVNGFISYTKTKKLLLVASRDFLVNYLINQEEDGSIICVTSTENCESDHPEIPGVVRAGSPMSGFILKVNPIDPTKTIMQKMTEFDPKGGIPDFAIQTVMKNQGL